MSRRFLSLVLGAALCHFLVAAPGAAGKKEDELLAADVDEIQRQVYELRRLLEKQQDDFQRLLGLLDVGPQARQQQAEFNANVEALRGEIRTLSGRFDDTGRRLFTLEQRVAASCRGGTSPLEEVAGSETGASPTAGAPDTDTAGAAAPPSPEVAEALFRQAYSDYIKDNFELAVSQFREYVGRYPDSDLADNAQYWVGMALFAQKKHEDAILAFDDLADRYPSAENTPEALYRKGLALLELSRLGQAVLVFNDVGARYPDSAAAAQAQERLRELASGGR